MKRIIKVVQTLLLIIFLFILSSVGSDFVGEAGYVKAQSCVQPPTDLVSWWPGDGNADDIQHGNDGTLQNGVTFAPSMVEQGFSLDGVDDFIEVPDNPQLDLTGSFTLDAWVAGHQTIIIKGVVGQELVDFNYVLDILADGTARFGFMDNNGTVFSKESANPVPLDTFIHIAGVYDSNAETLQIYINGVPDSNGSVSTAGSTGTLRTNDVPFRIGARFDAKFNIFDSFFDGRIDEVEVFNRALSEGEIQSLFNAGSAGKCKVTTVEIDIKPGSDPNSINPKSNGKIPVAILSSPDFDATTEVDKTSLTFGRTGDEQSLAKCTKSNEDVNGDELDDVVCHFNTQDTGFQQGDTKGVLKGMTVGGVPIEGSDSVRVLDK